MPDDIVSFVQPQPPLSLTNGTVGSNTLVVPSGLPGAGDVFGGVIYSTTEPADPWDGALWFNPDTGTLRLWTGTHWVDVMISRPAQWDAGEARWDIAAQWDAELGGSAWDDGNTIWDGPGEEAIWDAGGGLFVMIGGDTMTGPLVLAQDPTAALGAATKQYVDNAIGALKAQLGLP